MKHLEELVNQRVALTREIQKAIQQTLEQFMKDHPQLKAIGWTQYTPYWNDGAPCVFGKSELYVALSEDYDRHNLDGEGWVDTWKLPEGMDRALYDDIKGLDSILDSANEALQEAFGDGVMVIVTQNGIEIHEYENEGHGIRENTRRRLLLRKVRQLRHPDFAARVARAQQGLGIRRDGHRGGSAVFLLSEV